MVDGLDESRWGHTSVVLAAVINSNPFREGDAVRPDQLNPYAANRAIAKPPQMKLRDLMKLVRPG